MHTLTRRIALTLAAFGLTTLLAGQANAAPTARKGDRQEHKLDRMCARIACTDAQKAQLKTLREANAPQIKAAREAIRGLRDQMKAEWKKASPDARALERLDDQIAAQHDKIRDLRRAAKLKVHGILTAEQRTKLAQAKQRRGEGKHGRRGGKAR